MTVAALGTSSATAVLKPVKASIATTSTVSRTPGAAGPAKPPSPAWSGPGHFQQPCPAGALAHRGEVDGHGHVLLPLASVAPAVLIDPKHGETFQSGRMIDQHPACLSQDRVVGRVLRDTQPLGHPGHGQVMAHQCLQAPAHRAAGEPGARLGHLAGILAPHVPTPLAAVAAHGYQQRGGSLPKGLMSQLPGHRVTSRPQAAVPVAPLIWLNHVAGQRRTLGLKALAGDLHIETVKAGERGQVRDSQGSVAHIEVFQTG